MDKNFCHGIYASRQQESLILRDAKQNISLQTLVTTTEFIDGGV